MVLVEALTGERMTDVPAAVAAEIIMAAMTMKNVAAELLTPIQALMTSMAVWR